MIKKVLAVGGFFYVVSWFLNLALYALSGEYLLWAYAAVIITAVSMGMILLRKKTHFRIAGQICMFYLSSIGWIPLFSMLVLAMLTVIVHMKADAVVLSLFMVGKNLVVVRQGLWVVLSLLAASAYLVMKPGLLDKSKYSSKEEWKAVADGLNRLLLLGGFYLFLYQFLPQSAGSLVFRFLGAAMFVLPLVLLFKDLFRFDDLNRNFPQWTIYLKAVGWIPYAVFMSVLRSDGFLSVVFPAEEFSVIGASFKDMFFEIALFYKVLFWPFLGAAAVYSLIVFIRQQRNRQNGKREKTITQDVLLLGGIFGLLLRFCSLFDSFFINLLSGLLELILIILLLRLLFNAVPDFLRKFKARFPRLSIYLTAICWYPFYRWFAIALIYGGYYSGLWVRGGRFEKFMSDRGYWVADVVDVLLILSLSGAAVYNYRRQKALKAKG